MAKISVGILGATGAVGQRFVQMLESHPWFELTHLYASDSSANKAYREAVSWRMETELPPGIADMTILSTSNRASLPRLVFSALDSSVAEVLEKEFAELGCVVVSNSSSYRMHDNVPLIIPEVNPEHLEIIKTQSSFPSGGFIVTNPNCTTVGLVMAIAPLQREFGLKEVSVVSMQAASGAGYPGVPSLDLIDNIVPFISGEEDKIATEPLKILGYLNDDEITQAQVDIEATCNRAPLRDGHLEVVSFNFSDSKPSLDEVASALSNFSGLPQQLKLPTAPANPIKVFNDNLRPQPALDRMLGGGMTVSIGRLREGSIFDYNLTLLVHNTIRGAAGAAILNAELLRQQGYLS